MPTPPSGRKPLDPNSFKRAPSLRHCPCSEQAAMQMHSRPKEQREAVRNLVHLVLTRDMGTFTPDRFKDWIKDTDARFRKVGLTLLFDIRSRGVHFTIKEVRSSRTAFKFAASTHVQFEDRDVVMSVEDYAGGRSGGA
jgi:hypothetical protein